MKEKLLIFAGLALLIIILVGLNAVSYVQKEKVPDTEIRPNRSTYNVGATGTRAFYDLLAETGRSVVRWQKPPDALLNYGADNPSTLIVIGQVQREFDEAEFETLLRWVSYGGRLVIIDRTPPAELIRTTAKWSVAAEEAEFYPLLTTDPSDQTQMTAQTDAARPVQPTILTEKINSVQTSRFAASVALRRLSPEEAAQMDETITTEPDRRIGSELPPPVQITESAEIEQEDAPPPPKPVRSPAAGSGLGSGSGRLKTPEEEIFAEPTPVELQPMITPTPETVEDEQVAAPAPVVHLTSRDKNLLVDFPYGSGQIIFLTDPYIVSNNGIGLVDNAQLAINLAASYQGITAFDEYHQGFGANNNLLINYFEGTPVISFLLQLAALIGFIFFTRSRRFARSLPETAPSRLSKLEYVAAMAELQQRTSAFDLAVENIYKDFRRRAARLVGADNFTIKREELAKLIAERSRLTAAEVDALMFKCEDIIYGEPTNKKEVLELIGRLRRLETELGLQRRR